NTAMNENKRDKVSIDQVLHGYSDGHRLLESSRSFGREAERIMFVLSDMSGPTMVKELESYLTGYPLHDSGVYALAKTWYAPEMDRPGCVWTHTLIIRFSDIPNMKDPRKLLSMFHRPNTKESWALYRSPVEVPIGDSARSADFELNQSSGLVSWVIAALYGSPETPVFIAVHNSSRFEDLVLRIWNQQWPSLRRSFSFCTGSISNRKLDDRFFDLQIVPKRSLDQIKRELPFAECLDSEKEVDLAKTPAWISLTAYDMLSSSNAKLRRFLWNFGADEIKGRKTFKKLVEVFLALEDVDSGGMSISELIKSVAKIFPTKKDGSRLKSAIFGSAKAKNRVLPTVGEIDLLRELSITGYHKNFDKKTLKISERAKTLWKSQQEVAKQLLVNLISYDLNPLG
ncbi:hypothetical protein KA005_49325, partial [bacterium]|nr:hypothetical protein [bacterium]